jgi:hypothetical protein
VKSLLGAGSLQTQRYKEQLKASSPTSAAYAGAAGAAGSSPSAPQRAESRLSRKNKQNLAMFTPFYPVVLKNQLTAGGKRVRLPLMNEVNGSVLVADLSGFTKLGEALRAEYGDGEGSAKLAQDVDHLLSEFILVVYAFGGDIIKFAGDALICLFVGDGEEADDPKVYEEQCRERALSCGLSLLDLVGRQDDMEHGTASSVGEERASGASRRSKRASEASERSERKNNN